MTVIIGFTDISQPPLSRIGNALSKKERLAHMDQPTEAAIGCSARAINQKARYNFFHLATRLLQPKVMSSMLRLLLGISMAATRGERLPWTAKNTPTML